MWRGREKGRSRRWQGRSSRPPRPRQAATQRLWRTASAGRSRASQSASTCSRPGHRRGRQRHRAAQLVEMMASWLRVCIVPCAHHRVDLCAPVQARERFDSDQQRLAAETWCWREKLQRSIDGCTTTGDMLVAGLADYDELDGLNCPVPGGFQVGDGSRPGVMCSIELGCCHDRHSHTPY